MLTLYPFLIILWVLCLGYLLQQFLSGKLTDLLVLSLTLLQVASVEMVQWCDLLQHTQLPKQQTCKEFPVQ